ncbi:hypothetical protein QP79_09870 [Enterococcus faecalis]|uniref:hypothetical protein n=1 Tax=Enterococcus faecalis TaxID=1351 RepID=UPI000F058751|nr:hypothetical protein [Enterococcus faecalis]RNA46385.1 hypothetical protein QP79_09870 [Enterococcus faecalis]
MEKKVTLIVEEGNKTSCEKIPVSKLLTKISQEIDQKCTRIEIKKGVSNECANVDEGQKENEVEQLKKYIKKFDLTYSQAMILLTEVKAEFHSEMMSNKLS